jgi:hypothetical protein
VIRRYTLPNLRPPQTVSLNRLLVGSFGRLPSPNLSLMMLIEELPGIVTRDRLPANVIEHNRNTATIKISIPTASRRRIQVETQVGDRNQVVGRDHDRRHSGRQRFKHSDTPNQRRL